MRQVTRQLSSHEDRVISGSTAQAMLERAGFEGVEILGPDQGKRRKKRGGVAAWAEGHTLRIGWESGWLMIDWSETGVEIQREFWRRWGAVTYDEMLDIVLKGEYILVDRRLLEKTLTVIRDILNSHTAID